MSFECERSVLGQTDRDLLESAVGPFYVAVLRVDFEPTPLVVPVRERAVYVVGLPGAECEEIG